MGGAAEWSVHVSITAYSDGKRQSYVSLKSGDANVGTTVYLPLDTDPSEALGDLAISTKSWLKAFADGMLFMVGFNGEEVPVSEER